MNAIQALSQLSYTPIFSLVYRASKGSTVKVVEISGIEPLTS